MSSSSPPPYAEHRQDRPLDWVGPGDLSDVLAAPCAKAEAPEASAEDILQAATILLVFGYVARARDLAERLRFQPPCGQFAILRLCRRLIEGAALLGTPDPSEAGVMLAPVTAAHKLVLLFPGQGGRFWGLSDPALMDRPDTSVLFLRSLTHSLYLTGISGLGADYPQTLDAIRRIADRLSANGSPPAIYCIGHSTGGYAALRYGLDLQARAVLSFSGPTNMDPRGKSGDPIAAHPHLRTLLLFARHMAADLSDLYMRAPQRPQITLCYGSGNAEDAVEALRMRDVPGARLLPLDGFDGHGTVFETAQRGQFDELVDQTLAV